MACSMLSQHWAGKKGECTGCVQNGDNAEQEIEMVMHDSAWRFSLGLSNLDIYRNVNLLR